MLERSHTRQLCLGLPSPLGSQTGNWERLKDVYFNNGRRHGPRHDCGHPPHTSAGRICHWIHTGCIRHLLTILLAMMNLKESHRSG